MKLKGVNNSSWKTETLIKKTFAELLEEKKEIKKITVTELVNRIGITRGAFYSHYENIYEVAESIEDELLETLFLSKNDEPGKYLDDIFDYLKTNEKIYSQILVSDDPLIFMNRLKKMIISKLIKDLPNAKELDVIFFTNGIINIIISYFRKEINEDLESICIYVKKIAKILF